MSVASPTTAARSRRILWLVFAGVCLVALVGLAIRFVPVLGPTGTAWGYCDDLTHARYAHLYATRFAPALQSQLSADDFVAAEQLADQQAGTVTTCDASPLNISLSGSVAQARVTEQRHAAIVTTLHLGGGDWRITAFPDPAILPFAVARHFCLALTRQDYAAAYALFAPNITAQLTQERYAGVETFADGTNGKVTSCTLTQLGVDLPNHAATAHAQVVRQNGPSGGADVTITLAQSGDGTWAITTLPTA